MGAAIRAQVEKSGPSSVCVALFTTGERSGARNLFAGRGFIPSGRTAPYVNKTVANSTRAFTQARDREFTAALLRLGVSAKNVYIDNLPGWKRVPDLNNVGSQGEIRSNARKFVNAAITRFGTKANYATMSDRDPSPDHAALGIALRERSTHVRSIRFYFPQYQMSRKPAAVRVSAESAVSATALRRAAGEYGYFNPAQGRYGIGWLSVRSAFGAAALQVKIWNGRGWQPLKPLGPGKDTSFLTTLKSYKHS